MGRQSTYTEAKADEICARIASGETLSDICRDAHMPERAAVYAWQEANPVFGQRFVRARDIGFDAIAEDAMRIANTPVTTIVVEESERFGKKIKRSDAVDHRKLQVWTRLQLLARWSPRYREANNVMVSGDAANPLVVNDQSAATRLAQLLAMAEARKSRTSDDSAEPEDDYSDLV